MLESGVFVDFRETAIHHANAQTFSVDAFVEEILSAKALQLIGEYVVVVVCNFLEISLNAGYRPIGDDFLHPSHERQPRNQGGIVVGSLNTQGIEPARLAENLCRIGVYCVHIVVVQRVVADVVKVGAVTLVTLDGFGIEIRIRVDLGIATVEMRAKTARMKFFRIFFEICGKGMVLFSNFVSE